ncbi:hypothetical protein Pyn_30728 [Prunus yedoensis var. nudiflora]|uniref:F-box domain-containing protein n=1 Tax=Prunus yedoensis var. nudiflora TaxID=2094558 RepID=A0A314ZAF1_PRUYE|nr:hypothetical protein Pyn_30728 [Prunus yedoensis var. nudiflora]
MEAYHDHPIPELPTEIIFSHILPRLQAEDLITRCRCVCKSWSSLIRSPSFVAVFHNFHCNDKRTTHFLFKKYSFREDNRYFSTKIEQQENAPKPLAELSYLTQCKAFKEFRSGVQSVHGLVCASTTMFDDTVSILNPTTRESNFPIPMCLYKQKECLHSLNITLGSVHSQTSTDSSWRPLWLDRHSDLLEEIRSGVCINGVVHWLHAKKKVIVAFDVREETFRALPLPQDYAQVFDDYVDQDNESDADSYCLQSARVVEVGGYVGVFVDKSWK